MGVFSNFGNYLLGNSDDISVSIPFGMTLEDYPSVESLQDSGTVAPVVANPFIGVEDARRLTERSRDKTLVQPSTSATGAFSSPGSVANPYVDAPLASQYGMNRQTAYQEALANTAHQREIEDLKKAGLNPVLGYSQNGSAVFAGSSSGSGGGSSGSESKSTDALFNMLGAAITLATGKSSIGTATSMLLSSAKSILSGE